MKVLNVQPFDNFGSIQRRSFQVASELRKEGVQTVFITPKKGVSFTKTALENSFKVYKTSCLRPVFIRNWLSLLHIIEWIRSVPRSLSEVYKIAYLEQPDVIHVNGFVCIQEAIVAAFCHRRSFLWNLIGTLYPRIIIVMFLPIIRMASFRVFVAKKLVPYYFGYSHDWIIYEPVNTDKFNPAKTDMSEIDILRKDLSLNGHQRVVGFLGSISPAKGLEFLIRSASFIKEKYRNIRLIIAGGFPPEQLDYRFKLKKLVHELGLSADIVFTGHIEHDRVPLVLSLFDVFVSASVSEGTPVSILEAMAMEKPVVATDVGGVSEQIVNDETGILVPPRNTKALADAIIHLLSNPTKANSLGRKARERVGQMFTLQMCVIQYKKLYENLTKFN